MTVMNTSKSYKVDPRLSSLVSSVCSNEGNIKDNISKVLCMLVKHQSSFVPQSTSTVDVSKEVDKSSLYDCSDVPNLSIELVYSLKRAIRGCASIKEECRVACSLLLSALLKTFSVCLSASVLLDWQSALLNAQSVGVGKAKADSRMCDMGKLCVSMVYLRSDLFGGAFEETTKSVLKTIVGIRGKKSYFTLPCDCLILEYLESVVVEDVKKQVCDFLLSLLASDQSSLLFTALSSFNKCADISIPDITNDSRMVIDMLPRLHPALKVIAKNRFSVLEPLIDNLFANSSRELCFVGVLILAHSDQVSRLSPSFVALAERVESQKRSKWQFEQALKDSVSVIISKYAESLKGDLASKLCSIPSFILRKLPITFFEQVPVSSIEVICKSETLDSVRMADLVHSILKCKKSFTNDERGLICKVLFGQHSSAIKPRIASLLTFVSVEEVKSLSFAISKSFVKTVDEEGPIEDFVKSFKKLSAHGDETVQLASSLITTILSLTEESSCFELMDELKGFTKTKSQNAEEILLFWTESVMSLLSMNSAFVRRFAEVLFMQVVSVCELTLAGIEPIFEAIDKKISNIDSFEVAEGEEDEDELNDSDSEVAFSPTRHFTTASDEDESEEDDMNDEEMEALDEKLAAAVSMHIKAKTDKKNSKALLLKTEQAIQSKAVSLIELISRAKELSPKQKFFFLLRVFKSVVALEAAGAGRKEHAARLLKACKNILDSCRAESLDWLSLVKDISVISGLREHSSGIMVSILSIALRHNCDISGIIGSLFVKSIQTNEGMSEISFFLKALANHNLAEAFAIEIESKLPQALNADIRSYSKSLLTTSLRQVVNQLKRESAISSFAMDLICDDIIAAKNPKLSWIKGQLAELSLWAKLTSKVPSRLLVLKTRLSDEKLIGQVDNIIGVISNLKQ